MMVEKRLLEALDACRAESDDLAQPEMAELAEQLAADPELAALQTQLAAFDRRVARVMHDVPVPSDLQAQILARLAAQDAPAATAQGEPAPLSSEPTVVTVAPRRWGRRVAGVLALAALVLVGVTLALYRTTGPALTQENVQEFAQQQYEQLDEAGPWQAMDSAPQQAYPRSSRVAGRAWRWKTLATPVDRNAVAYDLAPRGANYQVTLMVVRTKVAGLRPLPQKSPVWTQGRLVSAWQQGDLLYVLVLEAPPGGSRSLPMRYRHLVDTSPGLVS